MCNSTFTEDYYIPLCNGILFRVTRPFFLPPLPFCPAPLIVAGRVWATQD